MRTEPLSVMGIENNADWNFKDLKEMLGRARALKRNNREHEGIHIGPSMAPRFCRASEIRFQYIRYAFGFGPKFRDTDGEPTQPGNVAVEIVS